MVNSDKDNLANRRPRSLKIVVDRGRDGGDMDACLREFLDEYYLEVDRDKRVSMLAVEPSITDNDRVNAYLAAVAEHLALREHLEIPSWTQESCRFLRKPYFPMDLESLKASAIMESPSAFRRRMIFVSADPLYRPRRATAVEVWT